QLTLDQIQPVSAERGQFGPCLTDEAHRPLPACSSRGAATLEPEQVQQRSLRQLYPVASCKTLRSFRTRQRYLLRVDRLPSFRRADLARASRCVVAPGRIRLFHSCGYVGRPSRRCQPRSAVCTENSNSDVVMVKPAEDGLRTNDSGLMNRTRNRRILVQRPMRSDGVVIVGVGFQDPTQMHLAQDND